MLAGSLLLEIPSFGLTCEVVGWKGVVHAPLETLADGNYLVEPLSDPQGPRNSRDSLHSAGGSLTQEDLNLLQG